MFAENKAMPKTTPGVTRMNDSRFLVSLIDAISEAVIATDLQGTITYWNAAAEALYGWSVREVLGRNILDVTPTSVSRQQAAEIVEALQRGDRWEGEFDVQRRDGSVFLAHVSDTPTYDADSNIIGVIGVSRDVTAAFQREAEFRQIVAAVEQSNESIFIVAIVGHPLYLNPAFYRSFGYAGEELRLLGGPEALIVDQEASAQIALVLQSGDSWTGELELRARDGRIIPTLLRTSGIYDDSQRLVATVGICSDMTPTRLREAQLRQSEGRFAKLFDGSNVPMVMRKLDGQLIQANPAYLALLGYSMEELQDLDISDLQHPDERKFTMIDRQEIAAGRTSEIVAERRYVRKDGTLIRTLVDLTLLRDHLGNPQSYVAQIQDITELKAHQERLQDLELTLRSIIEQGPAVIYRSPPTDLRAHNFISAQVSEMLGIGPDKWLADPIAAFDRVLHVDDRSHVFDLTEHANRSGAAFAIEYRSVAEDGRIVWIQDQARLVRDNFDKPLYWQGMMIDISEKRALEEELRRQILHDSLTGLPNRLLLKDRIEQGLANMRRHGGVIAILSIDLDRFKLVNDSLGHAVGDELLISVASRLHSMVREFDTVSRFSGDEFVVLLNGCNGPLDAVEVALRILEEFREPLVAGSRTISTGVSIGIAVSSEGEDAEVLLRHADAAMYRAKSLGRNRFEIFDINMQSEAADRLTLEQELHNAIALEQFRVHYQPKIEIASDRVYGFEALVRWQHPERGLLLPGAFIDIAEDTGLIAQIGEWVLQTACAQIADWNRRFPRAEPLVVSVNFSASQFNRQDVVGCVTRALQRTGLSKERLTIEVTESVVVDDALNGTGVLIELHHSGISLSVDDFGTGYSSLSYLKHFPFDTLKIDRSFVDGLGSDPEDSAIVRTIITLAHELGMETIGEGVETAGQLAELKRLGCDRAQGFYFWPPMDPSSIEELLAGSAMEVVHPRP